MRPSTIGLAAVLVLTGISAGFASTSPDADVPRDSAKAPGPVYGHTRSDDGSSVVARRGRGSHDNDRNHHGGGHGGRHKGGHDDGPDHDKNDDHGRHDRNHA